MHKYLVFSALLACLTACADPPTVAEINEGSVLAEEWNARCSATSGTASCRNALIVFRGGNILRVVAGTGSATIDPTTVGEYHVSAWAERRHPMAEIERIEFSDENRYPETAALYLRQL